MDKNTPSFPQFWKETTNGLSEQIEYKWGEIIEKKYRESQRYYHTVKHIEEMKLLRDTYQHQLKSTLLVDYAIIFHDVIYEPKKTDNEERSADLFIEFAKEANLDASDISTVNEWILLTKKHSTPEHLSESGGSDDVHYFLDFDMAILGTAPNDYKEYAGKIWQEYSHIPRLLYCQKRAEVLKTFLQIPFIYATTHFRQSHELQARENIAAEIEALENEVKNRL